MLRTLVVIGLVACRGTQPVVGEPPPTSPPQAKSPDPWSVTVDAAPETAETKQQRAAAALGRVSSIKPVLAKLRGLSFDRDVPTEYQSTADFRTFVHREIAKELPPEKAKDISAALYHLGLLDKNINLAEVEEQAVTTQAGAYYDPKAKKFFLVMVPDSDLALDTISAHELTHALQDQHFDLDKYLPSTLDGDAAAARHFVVEGDATFAMLVYAIAKTVGKETLDPRMMKLLTLQVEQFAALDLAGLKDMSRKQAQAFPNMDADIKKSVDAMDAIPMTVLVPMLDSYMKGAFVAMTAYQHGGWAGVDALYKDPPQSTEQVLHPATKLYPTRDKPHAVTLAKLADVSELSSDVMGELQWLIYFEMWNPAAAKQASEGWGGDRYQVVRRKDGRMIALLATVWDTPGDATEFAAAYAQSLVKRFPGSDPKLVETGVPRPDGGKVFVKTAGARVYIVDGADDRAMLDQLVRSAKLE